jgi:hypothetical protein
MSSKREFVSVSYEEYPGGGFRIRLCYKAKRTKKGKKNLFNYFQVRSKIVFRSKEEAIAGTDAMKRTYGLQPIVEEECETFDATTPMLIPIIPEYGTNNDADDYADEDESSLFATSPITTPMNVDDEDDLDQERYLPKTKCIYKIEFANASYKRKVTHEMVEEIKYSIVSRTPTLSQEDQYKLLLYAAKEAFPRAADEAAATEIEKNDVVAVIDSKNKKDDCCKSGSFVAIKNQISNETMHHKRINSSPTIVYDWKIERIKLLGMAITGLKSDGTFLFKRNMEDMLKTDCEDDSSYKVLYYNNN